MDKSYLKKILTTLLVLLVLTPLVSNAFNLGEVVTKSLKDEPLNTDIEITDIPKNFDITKVKVSLANESQLWEIGLAAEPYHKDMQFKVYRTKDSKAYINIKTSKPINSQYVNFLLNVNHPQGRLVREYMVILKKSLYSYEEAEQENKQNGFNDFQLVQSQNNNKVVRFMGDFDGFSGQPILSTDTSNESDVKQEAQLKQVIASGNSSKDLNKKSVNTKPKLVVSTSPGQLKITNKINDKTNIDSKLVNASNLKTATIKTAKKVKVKESIKKPVQKLAKKSSTRAKPIVVFKSTTVKTVLTQQGDTLWDIATKYASSGNIQKMVMAIYKNNKDAFMSDSIHLLQQNKKLKIPTENELKKISFQQAYNFIASYDDKLTNNISKVARLSKAVKNQAIKHSVNRKNSKSNTSLNQLALTTKQEQVTKPQNIYKLTSLREQVKQKLNKSSKNQIQDINKVITSSKNIKTDKEAKPRLKIVSNNNIDNLSNKYNLSNEKLIAKQEEQQELKQQIALLQAQLRDVRKLVELQNEKIANKSSDNKLDSDTSNHQINDDNELETIIFSPFAAKDINKSNNTTIATNKINSSKQDNSTSNQSLVINKTSNVDKQSDSLLTTLTGVVTKSLSRLTKKVVNYNYSFEFIVYIISACLFLLIGWTYYYWRKYYYLQPEARSGSEYNSMFNEIDMPDFDEHQYQQEMESDIENIDIEYDNQIMSEQTHYRVSDNDTDTNSDIETDLESAVYNPYEEVMSDSSYGTSKFKDSLDLVKAYIELNDYITARKILDEILKTGSSEQKDKAKQVLETLPAA